MSVLRRVMVLLPALAVMAVPAVALAADVVCSCCGGGGGCCGGGCCLL
jgi:hypothetical protein